MRLPPDRSGPRAPEPALDALPTRWSRSWAIVVLVSTVAVAFVSLTGAPEVVRAPISLWFIAICPGMAVIRLLRLDEPIAEVMLAFALSLALAGLIPAVFLYSGAWSPAWSLTVLVAIAAVGLALDPVIVPRHSWALLGRAVQGRMLVLAGQADPAIGRAQPLLPPVPPRGPLARRPAPPLAMVRRVAPPQKPADEAAVGTLGSDPLDEDDSSMALRSAFDQIVGDIAKRRSSDD